MRYFAKLNRLAWKFWPILTKYLSLIPSSIIVSVSERRLVKCYFDGQDFIYIWKNNVLALMNFVTEPTKKISANVQFFTQAYLPKLGDTVLDVGSSYGTEMKFFSDLCGSEGKLICIEADVNAFRLMTKMAKKMELKNVVLLNFAVSNVTGVGFLETNWMHGTSNKFLKSNFDGSSLVISMRLESIAQSLGLDKINFVKMNIEGAEYDALLGMGKQLQIVEHFCISCHDFLGDETATKDQVLELLRISKIDVVSPRLSNFEPWARDYVFAKKTSI